jgi:hypothetical protein
MTAVTATPPTDRFDRRFAASRLAQPPGVPAELACAPRVARVIAGTALAVTASVIVRDEGHATQCRRKEIANAAK